MNALRMMGPIALLTSSLLAAPPQVAKKHARAAQAERVELREGWAIQSSAKVAAKGEAISAPGFLTRDWYAATVPATVVATLVKDGVYKNPYFGKNLRSLPGMTYAIGENFSNLPMSPESPFAASWWYRTQFVVPAAYKGKTVWLHFDGINYRANVWLNGKQVAKSDEMVGAWRVFELNVSDAVQPGKTNVLAVETFAPKENDLGITFVDWNPSPPDKNMGLWHEVYLSASGPVAVRHPLVATHFSLPGLDIAHLSVTAEVKNATNQSVKGTLAGAIESTRFSQEVELGPGESKEVTFTPDRFPQLNISNPRVWWPTQMGAQNFYPLEMSFKVEGKVSDSLKTKFGVREITQEMTPEQNQQLSVNGKKILVRGGGWSPDMMLRENPRRLEDEIRYVRDMNLNTIRLEGKLESEKFYELTDKYGILVMAGWCCCDQWEKWDKWTKENYTVAAQSLRDQMHRLRIHPSLLVWLNGSDYAPPADVEKTYLDIEKELQWPNPIFSSAEHVSTTVTGASGVREGIYNWVPPNFWLTAAHPEVQQAAGKFERTRAGATGFNTETSPGPAVPPVESLKEFLPEDHLWPIDEVWNYHAGSESFKDIHLYTDALNARYGPATGLADYAEKAQLMNYEGIRAMFEAFSRNKYRSSGLIQWMLNNAWPSLIWHLYDYSLRPSGGYFGAKKACESLHPMYSPDDGSIWVVNSRYVDAPGLKLTAKAFNIDLKEKFSQSKTLDAAADTSTSVLMLPGIPGLSTTYFVVLTLDDAAGKRLSSNLYWLSTKQDKIDWTTVEYDHATPVQFADMTALSTMPKVHLKYSSTTQRAGEEMKTRVLVENPSKNLAMFVHLKVNKGKNGKEILPVLWQDNYFSLLPEERQEVTAEYRAAELGGAKPVVELDGWNVN